MSEFELFWILGLANFRLAWMLSKEDGPFDLCTKWRNLFLQEDWLGRGVRCPYCTGFWTAALWAIFIPQYYLPVWFGLAAMVLVVDKFDWVSYYLKVGIQWLAAKLKR